MTEKDNRSNMEKLESMGNVCGQIADLLVERGCFVFKKKSFRVEGSAAIANGLLYFALECEDAYHELSRCGRMDELKLLYMDQDIISAAPAHEVLKIVGNIQVLLYALEHEVTYMTTGKPNFYAIGEEGLSREGLEFDFDLEVDSDAHKPDEEDQGNQSESSS